ncbi:MAG: hypothetical protein IJ787_03420 [Bacilli bacterium]|nr:hypothetical protein [Bacilli bacterium]
MHVTEEGKAIFEKAMERVGKHVVRIAMVQSDHEGASLRMDLIEESEATSIQEIDGVKFDLDERAAEYLSEAIFDAEGDNLRVIARPKGCCHGHHHEHGEGCCHNHEGCDCDGKGCECGDDCCSEDGCCHHTHKA